jgi:tRNA1Val (adenine37-N6)-methyltransferase
MNETLDALFDGQVRLYQSRKGYRFSLDTLLLAYFTRLKRGETIIDLGTGNGVVPLILSYRFPFAAVTGVELQPGMVERARRNVCLNGRQERVEILHGDVRAIDRLAPPAGFDAAVCNPPFRKPASGRLSPDAERRLARHEMEGCLQDFLRAADYLLRVKGRLTMVYPAVRAVDLLSSMRVIGIEPKRLRLVHSFADAEAALVLVEGVKSSRSGVDIEAPLVIYRGSKEYTAELAAMIAGRQE